jgi:O-antigen ligase
MTLDTRIFRQAADWLAVAVAASLPWSTSATGVLVVLWLVAVAPTLTAEGLRRELLSAAGGLPVLLWLFAVVGLLWATQANWAERWDGLGGFHRLLLIPLLLAHFRRSERGIWVLYGFFASVLVLLLLSWALILIPGLPWRGKSPDLAGVPVKDYILQSTEFVICAFALFGYAFDEARAKRQRWAVGLIALAIVFLGNIFFVVSSRTTLLIVPVLALLAGWRYFGWKGVAGAGVIGCLVGVALWFGSPYLHARLEISVRDLQAYQQGDAPNSTGLHLEFLNKSLSFVATAPVFGHGTGSIPEQFRHAATGQNRAASIASVNPHNQIFAVAIQLGLAGAAVLIAMWIAHFWLFLGNRLSDWIGMVVVVQNVISSLFNSSLFDFSEGWLYVFGVGVIGGMVLHARDAASSERLTAPQ